MQAAAREDRASAPARIAATIPARAGIGLRGQHFHEVAEDQPDIAWLEIHSENFFGAGGAPIHYLERVREHYPVSAHCVGLSLGSTDPLSQRHLASLKTLIARFEPGLVSDHLCWSSVGGVHSNDLLPLPYTEEALAHIAARIGQVQDFLGREILVENVSSYMAFTHSTIAEWDFLAEVARRADCGILLDVNNIYVSAENHGFDPLDYLRAIPAERVGEIHLAGFDEKNLDTGRILIDHHGARVADAVWDLYAWTIDRIGARPTLIEWDSDVPEFAVLLSEAATAEDILEHRHALSA